MLSERVKNVIVGLTILISLGLLMLGIFALGKFPAWGPSRPYALTLVTPSANGLGTGNKVNFQGVVVGNVQSVTLSPDMTTVLVSCSIDGTVNIPTNTQAYLGQQTIGTSYPPMPASSPRASSTASPGSATISTNSSANAPSPSSKRKTPHSAPPISASSSNASTASPKASIPSSEIPKPRPSSTKSSPMSMTPPTNSNPS